MSSRVPSCLSGRLSLDLSGEVSPTPSLTQLKPRTRVNGPMWNLASAAPPGGVHEIAAPGAQSGMCSSAPTGSAIAACPIERFLNRLLWQETGRRWIAVGLVAFFRPDLCCAGLPLKHLFGGLASDIRRDQASHDDATVRHGNGFPGLHQAQVLTKPVLQGSHADGLHPVKCDVTGRHLQLSRSLEVSPPISPGTPARGAEVLWMEVRQAAILDQWTHLTPHEVTGLDAQIRARSVGASSPHSWSRWVAASRIDGASKRELHALDGSAGGNSMHSAGPLTGTPCARRVG